MTRMGGWDNVIITTSWAGGGGESGQAVRSDKLFSIVVGEWKRRTCMSGIRRCWLVIIPSDLEVTAAAAAMGSDTVF